MTQYGNFKGMALPLLFFPFSVLSALSGLMMPEITRAHTRGDGRETRRMIGMVLKLTGAFSLAAGVGFVLFGPQLAQLVYRDAEVGRYVQVLGFVAPFMYLESMVDGVLKGLGSRWPPSVTQWWIPCSALPPLRSCCPGTVSWPFWAS